MVEQELELEKSTEINKEVVADQQLSKIVNPEGIFNVSVGNGIRKDIFWSRIGFSDRVFFKSYFNKCLKTAVKDGLISIDGHYKGNPANEPDGKETVFSLKPSSIVDGTLKVYSTNIDNKIALLIEGRDYTYTSDFKAIFFNKAPVDYITLEYDYYEQSIFDELYQTSFSMVLIYLSCRDKDDHNKKIFSSVSEVGKLNMQEVSEMINIYTGFNPPEDTLKN